MGFEWFWSCLWCLLVNVMFCVYGESGVMLWYIVRVGKLGSCCWVSWCREWLKRIGFLFFVYFVSSVWMICDIVFFCVMVELIVGIFRCVIWGWLIMDFFRYRRVIWCFIFVSVRESFVMRYFIVLVFLAGVGRNVEDWISRYIVLFYFWSEFVGGCVIWVRIWLVVFWVWLRLDSLFFWVFVGFYLYSGCFWESWWCWMGYFLFLIFFWLWFIFVVFSWCLVIVLFVFCSGCSWWGFCGLLWGCGVLVGRYWVWC